MIEKRPVRPDDAAVPVARAARRRLAGQVLGKARIVACKLFYGNGKPIQEWFSSGREKRSKRHQNRVLTHTLHARRATAPTAACMACDFGPMPARRRRKAVMQAGFPGRVRLSADFVMAPRWRPPVQRNLSDDGRGSRGVQHHQAILRQVVDPKRVAIRDAKSYCAILLDDNNRKPLTRLHFHALAKKYVGVFSQKNEERVEISSLDDLFALATRLLAAAQEYDAACDSASKGAKGATPRAPALTVPDLSHRAGPRGAGRRLGRSTRRTACSARDVHGVHVRAAVSAS
ncbi:MAG: hypothetical protein WC995_12800 [Lysobacteraceae bacterium]